MLLTAKKNFTHKVQLSWTYKDKTSVCFSTLWYIILTRADCGSSTASLKNLSKKLNGKGNFFLSYRELWWNRIFEHFSINLAAYSSTTGSALPKSSYSTPYFLFDLRLFDQIRVARLGNSAATVRGEMGLPLCPTQLQNTPTMGQSWAQQWHW